MSSGSMFSGAHVLQPYGPMGGGPPYCDPRIITAIIYLKLVCVFSGAENNLDQKDSALIVKL